MEACWYIWREVSIKKLFFMLLITLHIASVDARYQGIEETKDIRFLYQNWPSWNSSHKWNSFKIYNHNTFPKPFNTAPSTAKIGKGTMVELLLNNG